jgi:Ca-activated chloride channel family protein
MNSYKHVFLAMLFLICTTTVVLAYIAAGESSPAQPSPPVSASSEADRVTIDAALSRTHVLKGGQGEVSVALTISAENIIPAAGEDMVPVDLVVVLDRSGSMNGQKLSDARRAVIYLLERLGPKDRLSVVTYSDRVDVLFPLVQVNSSSRERLKALVRTITARGGTNLGSGLQNGIAALLQTAADRRQRKVILISDGLANHGITGPIQLGAIAAEASEHNLGISTVGVGYDFNEMVMTTIADHGAGNYYYLESPRDIAGVFEKEFETARSVAAGATQIQIELKDGLKLVNAGGFPISVKGRDAVIYPGTILAGQKRRIFLSYQVPTAQERTYSLGSIEMRYLRDGVSETIAAPELLHVSCVRDNQEVVAGINKAVWAEQVVTEDFGRLKEQVSAALRDGKKDEALQVIEEYEHRTATLNSSIASDKVSRNLDQDVKTLRQGVETTFAGAPAAVEGKKKQYAKELQYESYQVRRDKK